jgi:hypothetical protein
VIDAAWQLGKADREAMDTKLIAEAYKGNGAAKSQPSVAEAKDSEEAADEVGGVMSFARFMARYVSLLCHEIWW